LSALAILARQLLHVLTTGIGTSRRYAIVGFLPIAAMRRARDDAIDPELPKLPIGTCGVQRASVQFGAL
jgi:hypothetical protein